MPPKQALITWIFYLVFVIYTYAGSIALRVDHKSTKVKVLTGACSALALWALCFSVANAAPDHATALLWRKLAAIGWGTLYSFVLHLSLVTAGYKQALMRRRWLVWLIYLPAVLNVIVYIFLGEISDRQFNIMAYEYGWNSLWVDTVWNWFHTVYFASFSIASVLIMIRWLRTTQNALERRQAMAIMHSFLAAGVLGAVTDLLRLTSKSGMMPQIGIILVLIPTFTFFHLIRKYAYVESAEISKAVDIGQILNDSAREKLYARIGYIIHSMSFVNFANYAFVRHDYTPDGLLVRGLMYSLLLLFSGELIINARRYNVRVKSQEWILSLVVSVMLLAGIASYSGRGAITIWSLAFPMIVVAVVLSNPRVLALLAVTQMLAQLVLYFYFGFQSVQIELFDYVVRTLSIVFSIFLAYYVNRIYLGRLRDNEEAIRFQTALVEMSWCLRSLTEASIDTAMQEAVYAIRRYLPASRVIQMMVQEGSVWHSAAASGLTCRRTRPLTMSASAPSTATIWPPAALPSRARGR